jgi:hypothetical protein
VVEVAEALVNQQELVAQEEAVHTETEVPQHLIKVSRVVTLAELPQVLAVGVRVVQEQILRQETMQTVQREALGLAVLLMVVQLLVAVVVAVVRTIIQVLVVAHLVAVALGVVVVLREQQERQTLVVEVVVAVDLTA